MTIAGIVLVRQRPGIGNAIFMTLEDETGIANTILWPRTFERFRPIIMGARLISVTGVIAEREGRHPHCRRRLRGSDAALTRLSEHARRIDPTLPVDEAKRPVQGHGGIRARRCRPPTWHALTIRIASGIRAAAIHSCE